MFVRLA